MFLLVITEIRAQMLNIEARLIPRVETLHKLIQATLAGHQDDLVLGEPVDQLMLSLDINWRNRSGEIFNSPILSAFSARSRKASLFLLPT